MTEQEAIKYIEPHGFIADDVKDMCIDALEKQIPKQPNNIHQHVDHKTGYCPSCNTRLAHFGDMNYCYGCGQKLDWEVEE